MFQRGDPFSHPKKLRTDLILQILNLLSHLKSMPSTQVGLWEVSSFGRSSSDGFVFWNAFAFPGDLEKADDEVESPPPKEEEKSESGDGKENDDGSEEVDEDTKLSVEGDEDEGTEGDQEDSPSSDVKESSSEEKQVEKETENSPQPDEANTRPIEENKSQLLETEDTDDEPIVIALIPTLSTYQILLVLLALKRLD